MTENFEIYFADLNASTQEQLLEMFGVRDETEMNWDVVPLFSIPVTPAHFEDEDY